MDSRKPYHRSYHLTDIEKYLKGELSPAQMHEMEKAALKDPFLADAIEGLQSQPVDQSVATIDGINRLLLAEDEKNKAIIAPMRRGKWVWQLVAAVFILLAGTGIYFLANERPAHEQTIAQTQATTPAEEKAIQEPDSTNTALAFVAPEKKSTIKAAKQSGRIVSSPEPPAANTATPLAMAPANEILADSMLALQRATAAMAEKKRTEMLKLQEASAMKQRYATPPPAAVVPPPAMLEGRAGGIAINQNKNYLFRGRILDDNKLPIAGAMIMMGEGNNKRGTTTNTNGDFVFTSTDSLVNVQVSSLGHQQLVTHLSPTKSNQLQLNKDNSGLSEVVVTGMKPSARRSETAGAVSAASANFVKTDTVLTPSLGLETLKGKLQEALVNKLSPANIPKANIPVQLTFNNDGQVIQIEYPETTEKTVIDLLSPIIKAAGTWRIGRNIATGSHSFVLPLIRK